MNWFSIFAFSIFFGVTSPGIVTAFRALPMVQKLVDQGVKPWACDICMCFWTVGIPAAVAASIARDISVLLASGPAYVIALLVIRLVQSPMSTPPPDLE